MKTSEKKWRFFYLFVFVSLLVVVFEYFYWMDKWFLFLYELIKLTCISGLKTIAFPNGTEFLNQNSIQIMNVLKLNALLHAFLFSLLLLLLCLYLFIFFLQFLLILMFPWQWQEKKRLNILCVFLAFLHKILKEKKSQIPQRMMQESGQ